jgi:hypothetical protein
MEVFGKWSGKRGENKFHVEILGVPGSTVFEKPPHIHADHRSVV